MNTLNTNASKTVIKDPRTHRILWGFLAVLCLGAAQQSLAQTPARWKAHDTSRPQPPMVSSAAALPAPPPSDAVVLFDGSDLSKWRGRDGEPSKWVIKDGYMESVRGAGYIFTRGSFGDMQLHVEFATPSRVEGKSQGRGNSGVFLMNLYEVQVLDSYDNPTYADGQASAIYGQYPPLVNASRRPGEWQSYDIIFRRPRFHPDGGLSKPARFTILHNGVLVQDNVEAWGTTTWLQSFGYPPHADRLPLSLQDHGNPVRFRNIWLRELPESARPGPPAKPARPLVTLTEETLDLYTGTYESRGQPFFAITRQGTQVSAKFFSLPGSIDLLTHSKEEFSLRWTAAKFVFELDSTGKPTAANFHIGGDVRVAKRVN